MKKKRTITLHKVKKQWVAVATSSLALASMAIGVSQASADDVVASPVAPATETVTTETQTELVTTSPTTETETQDKQATSDVQAKTQETQAASETTASPAQADETSVVTTPESQPSISEHPLSQQELPTRGGRFVSDAEGHWSYVKDDVKVTGWQNIDGAELYFDQAGQQIKGDFVQHDGQSYYLDPDSGKLWVNRYLDKDGKHYAIDAQGRVTEQTNLPTSITGGHFTADADGNWSYITAQGDKLTGFNTVDGVQLYFDETGKQLKGQEVTLDGKTYYLNPNSGAVLKNSFQTVDGPYSFSPKQTVYYNQDGERVTGLYKTIDGKLHYFYAPTGHMAKDAIVSVDDKQYIFNSTGDLVRNSFYAFRTYEFGKQFNFYFANDKGEVLTGPQIIDGYLLYFDNFGRQLKDGKQAIDGKYYYFDKDNGHVVKNQWVSWLVGMEKMAPLIRRYNAYAGADGVLLTGPQTIDGKLYYFADDGTKAENGVFLINGVEYLFNDKGELVTNNSYAVSTRSWIGTSYTTYYADEQGRIRRGWHTINNEDYYFGETGQALSGPRTIDGKTYLLSGGEVRKDFFGAWFERSIVGSTFLKGIYATDSQGLLLEGVARAKDGNLYYFQPEAFTVKEPTWKEIDGKLYHFTKGSFSNHGIYPALVTTNARLEKDGKNYLIDANGVATEEKNVTGGHFQSDADGNWYYYTKDGQKLTGFQTVDGVQLYFDADGKQVKGSSVTIDGKIYSFDKDSGQLLD